MGLRQVRRALVGSLVAVSAFAAINASGIASAAQSAEQCGNWKAMLGGGRDQVCVKVNRNVVSGQAILSNRLSVKQQ